MERVETVVTFAVADSLFAVEVGIVQEILSPQKPSRLPKAPPHFLGLIDVRGTSVALVDLRCLLGEDPRPDDEDTRIMLLCFDAQGERHHIALRVDRVIEVAQLDDNGHVSPLGEAKMLDWDPRMLLGIGRRDGMIIALLEIRAIFDPTLMSATRALNATAGPAQCPN